jgi:peptidoglycan/LPS O-acetylase OafA/YrhL
MAAPVTARLWTIDALRGAAALGVVLTHASSVIGAAPRGIDGVLRGTLWFGRYGVWLFFVISGFCIHYRWALGACDGRTAPPDFLAFWRRRIRRLYPPYLVALLIFVWLRFGGEWTTPHAMRAIGLHLLMLQNLDVSTVSSINEVFWTLAIEEQLYLLYFVLVRLRAQSGWPVALAAGLAARLAWFGVAGALHRLGYVEVLVTQSALAQWPVWMLGALCVEAMLGLVAIPRLFTNAVVCVALLAVGAAMSYSLLYVLPPGTVYRMIWFSADVVWGLGFFVALNLAVRRQRDQRAPSVAGSVLAAVGLFSYSLYLTHEVVTSYGWSRIAPVLAGAPAVLVITAATLASVVLARMFFLLFERPFLSASSQPARAAAAF